MQIHVAIITHRHGTNLYADRTEEGLRAQVAKYCREWWDEVDEPVPVAPDGLGDDDVVARYFDAVEWECLTWFPSVEIPPEPAPAAAA